MVLGAVWAMAGGSGMCAACGRATVVRYSVHSVGAAAALRTARKASWPIACSGLGGCTWAAAWKWSAHYCRFEAVNVVAIRLELESLSGEWQDAEDCIILRKALRVSSAQRRAATGQVAAGVRNCVEKKYIDKMKSVYNTRFAVAPM